MHAAHPTTFIGNYFEWHTDANDKVRYYYAGGQRIAMRVGTGPQSAVYSLHGDHLGSVSMTTNALGEIESQMRFTPFGEELTWENSGISPTDFGFTSQRNDRYIYLNKKRAQVNDLGTLFKSQLHPVQYSGTVEILSWPSSVLPQSRGPQKHFIRQRNIGCQINQLTSKSPIFCGFADFLFPTPLQLGRIHRAEADEHFTSRSSRTTKKIMPSKNRLHER